MEAGQEFGVKPTGPSDIRRIEGAIFNWNADMTYENNPIEMGLDRLVAWDLPDEASISLKALKAIREKGVQRKINGVEIDGDPFPALNNVKWPVTDGSAELGQGHVGDLLPQAEEEHRLRLAADGQVEPGRDDHDRERVGNADRHGRRDAVRRPRQDDPRLLGERYEAAAPIAAAISSTAAFSAGLSSTPPSRCALATLSARCRTNCL